MKIIAVGDVHGTDLWKKVAEAETDFDKFIFIGDYFDNFPPHTGDSICANFREILEFQKTHGDKVVMLVGNHDFHYMGLTKGRFSGYDEQVAERAKELLDKAPLQVCYQQDNVLFSHAGVSTAWLKLVFGLEKETVDIDYINERFWCEPQYFNFIIRGGCDPSGDDPHQGPLWIRPDSLKQHMPMGLVQVVGHTHMKQITLAESSAGLPQLILIDAPNSGEYLIIENGEIKPKKLKKWG
jgi:hypothetical protein